MRRQGTMLVPACPDCLSLITEEVALDEKGCPDSYAAGSVKRPEVRS